MQAVFETNYLLASATSTMSIGAIVVMVVFCKLMLIVWLTTRFK